MRAVEGQTIALDELEEQPGGDLELGGAHVGVIGVVSGAGLGIVLVVSHAEDQAQAGGQRRA